MSPIWAHEHMALSAEKQWKGSRLGYLTILRGITDPSGTVFYTQSPPEAYVV